MTTGAAMELEASVPPQPARHRWIAHIDLDAFYAAVELLDHPEYRATALIVGADPKGGRGRGVVVACSYEARKFGIRSAMPIARAYHLCPQGTYVRPRFERYEEVSEQFHTLLDSTSLPVQLMSIDEAVADLTAKVANRSDAEGLVRELKARLRSELGLSSSVGVAPTRLLAKIASDLHKPDGLVLLGPDDVPSFLAPLPLAKVPGIGPKTIERLHAEGLETVGDLSSGSRLRARELVGDLGLELWRLAHGELPEEPWVTEEEGRSLSTETTFPEDVSSEETLHRALERLATDLHGQISREGLLYRNVGLKLRYADFRTLTRSITLTSHHSNLETIRTSGRDLLQRAWQRDAPIRLLGLRLSMLRKPARTQQRLEV